MARFGKRRSFAVRSLGVALLGALAGPVWAAPLRVVVRVTDPGDQALLARIRGQTSDLPVQLIPVAGDGEAMLAEQMVVARQLAERHEAGAVVWFTRVLCPQMPGAVTGILVQLSQPALRTVLVHSTGSTGSAGCERAAAPLPSHALEEAAIAVRSALSAVANGGNIGVQAPARRADTLVQTAARAPPASSPFAWCWPPGGW